MLQCRGRTLLYSNIHRQIQSHFLLNQTGELYTLSHNESIWCENAHSKLLLKCVTSVIWLTSQESSVGVWRTSRNHNSPYYSFACSAIIVTWFNATYWILWPSMFHKPFYYGLLWQREMAVYIHCNYLGIYELFLLVILIVPYSWALWVFIESYNDILQNLV